MNRVIGFRDSIMELYDNLGSYFYNVKKVDQNIPKEEQENLKLCGLLSLVVYDWPHKIDTDIDQMKDLN